MLRWHGKCSIDIALAHAIANSPPRAVCPMPQRCRAFFCGHMSRRYLAIDRMSLTVATSWRWPTAQPIKPKWLWVRGSGFDGGLSLHALVLTKSVDVSERSDMFRHIHASRRREYVSHGIDAKRHGCRFAMRRFSDFRRTRARS